MVIVRRSISIRGLAVLREVIGAAKVLGLKIVDDGDGSGVPHGCSYSRKSSNALFNRNVAGATLDTMYPLACRSAPASTEPVGTEPVSTEPASTEPVSTEPVS